MPSRKYPLITNQFYHIYNRTIDSRPIFTSKRICRRGIFTLDYYRFDKLPTRLSILLKMARDKREEIIQSLYQTNNKIVDIIAFCLMPNHFHLVVKQVVDNGISRYLANFQNSITRYFNVRSNSTGYVFGGQFKSVRVQSEEQLLHLTRYIHLNPYTSYVVKKVAEIEVYPWSSFQEYTNNKNGICNKEGVLSYFKNSSKYREFVLNQADYQRKLKEIEHLVLEKEDFELSDRFEER